MKKLISILLSLTVLPALAGNLAVQSFINPTYASVLILTNNYGYTNLNYIAQNQIQGTYTSGGLTLNISTNFAGFAFTNNTPVNPSGTNWLPGSLTVFTNGVGAVANGVILSQVQTNTGLSQANLLQDVSLSTDAMYQRYAFGDSATTGNTNFTLGLIRFRGYPATGTTSNVVSAVFSPVSIANINLNNPNNPYLYPGLVNSEPNTFYGSLVGGVLTSQGTWQITFTNVATAGVLNEYAVPVPSWRFAGSNGIRCRGLFIVGAAGGANTNSFALTGLDFLQWQP
jgi:hypothetical protein